VNDPHDDWTIEQTISMLHESLDFPADISHNQIDHWEITRAGLFHDLKANWEGSIYLTGKGDLFLIVHQIESLDGGDLDFKQNQPTIRTL
jgi:hypothetical protein